MKTMFLRLGVSVLLIATTANAMQQPKKPQQQVKPAAKATHRAAGTHGKGKLKTAVPVPKNQTQLAGHGKPHGRMRK